MPSSPRSATAPVPFEEADAPTARPDAAAPGSATGDVPPTGRHRPRNLRRGLTGVLAAAALSVTALVGPGALPAQAAHHVGGGLEKLYTTQGGERGVFGQLQTNELHSTTLPGMAFAKTYNSSSRQWYWLTWTAAHGAIPVQTTGAIGARWEGQLAASGVPSSVESCSASGVCRQDFERTELVWTSWGGTHRVSNGFRALYSARGGYDGWIGAPTDEEHAQAGYTVQNFRNAATGTTTMMTWSAEGGRVWSLGGAIAGVYRGAQGELGVPRSNEYTGLRDGGAWQAFSGGRVYWSPATGAQKILWGPIMNSWTAQGSENGAWGYPASGAWRTGSGWQQNFGNGVARQYEDGSVRFTPYRVEAMTADGQMDEAAAAAGFGRATGASTPVRSDDATVRYRRYAQGVVVRSDRYGSVPLDTRVFESWRQTTIRPGVPTGSRTDAAGRLVTTLDNGRRLAYHPDRGLVLREEKTLDQGSALVIGDSQVVFDSVQDFREDTQDTWVARGIQSNGYRTVIYGIGGIGFVQDNSGASWGSYQHGVVDNAWQLPSGDPGVIYVQASGNDVYRPTEEYSSVVRPAMERTLETLKKAYPHSRIILGGLKSFDEPRDPGYNNGAHRNLLSDVAQQVAREEGATFLPLRGVDTQYATASKGYLLDGVHYNLMGQRMMAPVFAERFLTALRQAGLR